MAGASNGTVVEGFEYSVAAANRILSLASLKGLSDAIKNHDEKTYYGEAVVERISVVHIDLDL